jgi:hypothetical protein
MLLYMNSYFFHLNSISTPKELSSSWGLQYQSNCVYLPALPSIL